MMRAVSGIVLTILIASCATPPETPPAEPFMQQWRDKAEASPGYSPPVHKRQIPLPEVRSQMEATAVKQVDNPPPLPTKKITLKMHKTDITVLLRALARAVDQNLMISGNVRGAISINVSQAPWDQVFLSILDTQGLVYERKGDIIRIITAEDKENRLQQLDKDSAIKLKQRELEQVDPLVTHVVSIQFADPAALKDNLSALLTKGKDAKSHGNIMLDETTHSLIIQASLNDLKRMIALIEEIDRPIPQVQIEAHIVETTTEVARQLGVQWGGVAEGDVWVYPGSNSTGVLGSTLSSEGIDPTSGFAVNFPADLTSGMGFTLGVAAEKIGSSLLAAQLSALQTDGKLNILSSPSITTMDNREALIESGDSVPVQSVEDNDVKIEYRDAVLSLKVTPHIIDGKAIKLTIDTTKDELDFTRTVAGNPTIVTKKATTSIILFDGQTTVIGGLNKETRAEDKSGVPFLEDIPLLGYLFKSRGTRNKMEELLIFITPRILNTRNGLTQHP